MITAGGWDLRNKLIPINPKDPLWYSYTFHHEGWVRIKATGKCAIFVDGEIVWLKLRGHSEWAQELCEGQTVAVAVKGRGKRLSVEADWLYVYLDPKYHWPYCNFEWCDTEGQKEEENHICSSTKAVCNMSIASREERQEEERL